MSNMQKLSQLIRLPVRCQPGKRQVTRDCKGGPPYDDVRCEFLQLDVGLVAFIYLIVRVGLIPLSVQALTYNPCLVVPGRGLVGMRVRIPQPLTCRADDRAVGLHRLPEIIKGCYIKICCGALLLYSQSYITYGEDA